MRDRGWTGAIDLKAGDVLVLQDGGYIIVEKTQHEILETPVTVYNFEVEDFHTYYVSKCGVLVHNMCAMERGIGGKGWVGDKSWRENLEKIDTGGTIEILNGGLPTEAQAKRLIAETGGKYLRTEGPHKGMNPHKYVHINYTTKSGKKGTIRLFE